MAMLAFRPHAALSQKSPNGASSPKLALALANAATPGMLAYGRFANGAEEPRAGDSATSETKPDEGAGEQRESDRALVELMVGGILGEREKGTKPKGMKKAAAASAKRRPAAACGAGVRKRPAAAKARGKLVLGCSKCSRSPTGCGTCRNPAFGGKRG